MADFAERIAELADEIGDGDITGKVTYEKVYAVNIHELGWLNFMGQYGPKELHVHSGQGKFLEQPLLDGADGWMETIARRVLDPDGVHAGMAEAMRDLKEASQAVCPVETGALRDSARSEVEG